ncbi:tripartite tricarboxylate transporter TctB family protein [Paracoccus sp. NSM]|uniref:tripartite tricarboxylate transporter TctB family protein n=1 Tax=Paracoccus sp. NSM TaxID=3457784 RepID=UPI0040371013
MRLKDTAIALVMTGAGLGYLGMIAGLPEREGVDATTVPTILAWMMIGLGLTELVGALRKPAAPVATGAGNMATVAVTLVLIAGYIAALRPLGFPIATAIYLFLQFMVLTPQGTGRRLPLYAGLAVLASGLIFATFRYGFDLLLPAGPLTAMLN